MNRKLIVVLFALASLPAVATSAEAFTLTRTVPMGCTLNAADGEALKVRMRLTNTAGTHLSQGSKVRIGIRYRVGGSHPRFGRTIVRYMDQTLWRDVPANSAIGFDQPKGRHYYGEAFSCAATVTVASTVKLDRKTDLQRPPLKLPR
jgi:hypothetical protein